MEKSRVNQNLLKRIKTLKDDYSSFYNENADDVFVSPGRVELIGNHTDHNNGKVIVSSINLNILALTKRNNDNVIRYYSKRYPVLEIDLNDLSIDKEQFGKPISIIKGIAFRLKELGYNIGGFNIATQSNIFKGAGVSSSASFEILIGKVISYYYNEDKIDPLVLAQVGQYAESVYFNKPCGYLDQMAISIGGINFFDFKKKDSPGIKRLFLHLNKYNLVLVDTKSSHSSLTYLYEKIINSMKDIASYFNKDNLREVNELDFINKKDELISKYGEYAYKCAYHYFNENKRVEEAYFALLNRDEDKFISLINESGDSSYYNLRNCCVINDQENLPQAIKLSKKINPSGACRIHGGGFAGTIIALVKKEESDAYISKMREVYGDYSVKTILFSKNGTARIGALKEFEEI